MMVQWHKEKNYINLLSKKIEDKIKNIDYDHILFSYHGIPISHLKISDPTNSHCYKVNNCCSTKSDAHQYCYKHQVLETTEAVVKKLNIDEDKYSNAFQSRLPNEAWLKPYTDDELVRLAKEGKKKLVIVTPAFVTDCLETLEEMQARQEYEDDEDDEEDWEYATEEHESMDDEGGALSEVGAFESDYFGAISLGESNDEE